MNLNLDNRGYTLSEVLISGFILVLVVAGFAKVSIASMSSFGNVKSRDVAYSIAKEIITGYERDTTLIPSINVGDNVTAEPLQQTSNTTRKIGTEANDKTAITQKFSQQINFVPVDINGNELVKNNLITQDSNLVKITAEVSWQSDGRNLNITQESFVREN